MGKVSIVRTDSGISPALVKALDLIGGIGAFVRPRDVIMLKPNINGTEGVTSLELVEALIVLLKDMGAKKVFIGEATFGSEKMTDMFFAKSGYADLASRLGVSLMNLNRSQAVDVPVKNPHVMKTLKIAREVFAADRIINIPVMKVHYAAGITLALKNLKGLLVLDEKRHFHEAGLDRAIVDLNNTLKPDLNIVDATRCMERMGPRGGDPVDLNLVIAGASSAEVDCVGARVMEHTLDDVKHLDLYVRDNGIDPSRIETVGEAVDDVKHPFRKAAVAAKVPPGCTVHESDACSSCMNALYLSFEMLGQEMPEKFHVFLGSKKARVPSDSGCRIAFGNCRARTARSYDVVVKGCPPYPFDLKEKLALRL